MTRYKVEWDPTDPADPDYSKTCSCGVPLFRIKTSPVYRRVSDNSEVRQVYGYDCADVQRYVGIDVPRHDIVGLNGFILFYGSCSLRPPTP